MKKIKILMMAISLLGCGNNARKSITAPTISNEGQNNNNPMICSSEHISGHKDKSCYSSGTFTWEIR